MSILIVLNIIVIESIFFGTKKRENKIGCAEKNNGKLPVKITGDYELRVTSYDLRFTSYELRFTSYDLRVASCELRVTSIPLQKFEGVSPKGDGVVSLRFSIFALKARFISAHGNAMG